MGWLTDRHRKNQNENVWPDKSLNTASHLNQAWVLHQPEKSRTRQSRKSLTRTRHVWKMRRNQPCKSQIQKNNHTERETILTRTIHKADTQANKSSNSAWQEPGKKKTVRTGNQVWYKPDISLSVQWRSYIIAKFVFSSVGLQIFVQEKTVQHTDTEPQSHTDRQTDRIPKRHNKFVFKMYLWFFSRKDSRASTTSSSSLMKSVFNFPSKHLRSKVSSHFLISRILK